MSERGTPRQQKSQDFLGGTTAFRGLLDRLERKHYPFWRAYGTLALNVAPPEQVVRLANLSALDIPV